MDQAKHISRPPAHRIARFLYRILWICATPVLKPYLSMRARHGKEDMNRLGERKGVAGVAHPQTPVVWIHGASVGESISALPVIDRMLRDTPELSILVTTGTVTSAKLMAERLPRGAIHQYVPLDHPVYVKRFLNYWQPEAAFWLESEFWPNLIVESAKRSIPLGLLNGRMSDASFKSWRRQRWAIEPILSGFQVCHGQDQDVAEKLKQLGATNVVVSGNLKLAAPPLPDHAIDRDLLHQMIGERPTWLTAQTAPGEEEIAARIHQKLAARMPGLLTIMAPRHPERGGELEEALSQQGLNVARRSRDDKISASTDIYLADTMGELGMLFRLVDIVFLGRSLVEGFGGSNSLEPARLRCAILQGPYTENFSDLTEKFMATGALQLVADEEALESSLENLFGDRVARQRLADAASNTAKDSAGVLELVIGSITPLLPAPRQYGGDHAPS